MENGIGFPNSSKGNYKGYAAQTDPIDPARLAYSRREAAKLIGCSPAWLSQRIANDEIKSRKISGRRFIARDDLLDFIKGRAVGTEVKE